MWRTFIEEFKHIFKNKWRPWEWLVICFIPFIYGFFYMNAYWNPFGKTENLRIGVVDLNKTDKSQKLVEGLKNGNSIHAGSQTYEFHIEDATSLYDVKTETAAKNLVEQDKYQAVIIIDSEFDKRNEELIGLVAKSAMEAVTNQNDMTAITTRLNTEINKLSGQLVTFYNSIKYNYLAGEMTNFGAGLSQLELKSILPQFEDIKNWINANITKMASAFPTILQALTPAQENTVQQFVSVITRLSGSEKVISSSNSLGDNINTYGFGLAPYFVCIALWAGSLVTIFLIKNKRYGRAIVVGTFKHYFGKSMVWVLTGWIQTLILITGITLQGVNLGGNQWVLFLTALAISTLFMLTVQGIAFVFRYGDLADFTAVILLIVQLISSSGTFPIQTQNEIFKIVNPVIPFTYAIAAIRETFYAPQAWEVFKNILFLLVFPVITTSLALIRNLIFDYKKRRPIYGMPMYKSFEIHLGDH